MDAVPALKYLFVLVKGEPKTIPIFFLHFSLNTLPHAAAWGNFLLRLNLPYKKAIWNTTGKGRMTAWLRWEETSGDHPAQPPRFPSSEQSQPQQVAQGFQGHVFHPKACGHQEPVDRFIIAPPRWLRKAKSQSSDSKLHLCYFWRCLCLHWKVSRSSQMERAFGPLM